jgi:hypothetical protein
MKGGLGRVENQNFYYQKISLSFMALVISLNTFPIGKVGMGSY